MLRPAVSAQSERCQIPCSAFMLCVKGWVLAQVTIGDLFKHCCCQLQADHNRWALLAVAAVESDFTPQCINKRYGNDVQHDACWLLSRERCTYEDLPLCCTGI